MFGAAFKQGGSQVPVKYVFKLRQILFQPVIAANFFRRQQVDVDDVERTGRVFFRSGNRIPVNAVMVKGIRQIGIALAVNAVCPCPVLVFMDQPFMGKREGEFFDNAFFVQFSVNDNVNFERIVGKRPASFRRLFGLVEITLFAVCLPFIVFVLGKGAKVDAVKVCAGAIRGFKQFFQGVWFNPVVGIDKEYVFSPCDFEAGVAGGGKSAVCPADDADAGIAVGVSGENFRTFVGRAVVDADDFDVGKGLFGDAVEALGEKFFHIENRNDYGNLRRVHGDGSPKAVKQKNDRFSAAFAAAINKLTMPFFYNKF